MRGLSNRSRTTRRNEIAPVHFHIQSACSATASLLLIYLDFHLPDNPFLKSKVFLLSCAAFGPVTAENYNKIPTRLFYLLTALVPD